MAAIITMFKNTDNTTNLEAGTIVFAAGETGKDAYVVVEGELDIVVKGKIVATIGPGGIAGEMALIDTEPRSADCIARTACRVVPIDQRRFTFLIQETPFFAVQVMRIMAERLRSTNALAFT